MTEISPTAALMERLEEVIEKIISDWRLKHPSLNAETARQEQEWFKKFSDLLLPELHEILDSGILTAHLAAENDVSAAKAGDSLQAGDFHQLRESCIPDQSLQITPVRKWLDQQEKEGLSVTGRLYSALDRNAIYLECIEEKSRAKFLLFRGVGEGTWKEFVARRGY